MKIVLDIYGGDNSPYAPIDGAVEYLKNCAEDVTVVLAGDENVISKYLKEQHISTERLEILHAPDEVDCHDEPTSAVRKKPNSSMVMAVKAVAQGDADGIVSSGSTGALYASSLSRIKRIPGITRPALPTVAPTIAGTHTLICDSGANADCIPEFLTQFAVLGSCYMRTMYGVDSPKVGLISNGTEDEKGNTLTREANTLMRGMQNINFVGNVEAREILTGNVDVVVCDGFTGNVILKTIEGSIKAFGYLLKKELMSSLKAKVGGLLIKKNVNNFKKTFDYREVGGAPLLGINGCVFKAHGSSDKRAYQCALEKAEMYIRKDVLGVITEELGKIKVGSDD